jgi:hypothetical protein
MIEPKVLVKGNFEFSQIDVNNSAASNRKINPKLEKEIDNKWQSLNTNPHGKRVWNAITYRLNNSYVKNNILYIELAEIEYKVRCIMKDLPAVEKLGEDYYHKGASIGTLLKTSDNKYIFGELAGNTMNSNKIDFIGGVLSKDELPIQNSLDLKKALFKEIKEEINVDDYCIKSTSIIGMVLSHNYHVVIISLSELNIDSKEVLRLFSKQNDNEMKSIIFVEESEISKFLKDAGNYKPAVEKLLV